MHVVRPGEGELLCSWESGCRNHEIEGLGYCLRHMPDDLLEEAEQLARCYRCRHGYPGHTCHSLAVSGTNPPRCKTHGANAGSVLSKRAAGQVVEGRVQDRLAAIMAESGERLLAPAPIGNPLVELLSLAAEMAEWKQILKEIVVYLLSTQRIRSAHNRVGEQLRAEVLLFERAQERYAKILLDIQRAGIEQRLMAIEESQARLVEQALITALNASGLDLLGQDKARQVLRRELVKASKAS